MGIYLFKRQVLLDVRCAEPRATDFGKEVFPRGIAKYRVMAHVFDGYWEDLGTVRAYHEANLALASDNPPFDFHSPEGVIYTHMRNLPASRLLATRIEQSLVSDGCVLESGSQLERCMIGQRTRIGHDAHLRDTVIPGADRIETAAQRQYNRQQGLPDVGIGDGAVIARAILDKDCRIGRGVRIVNEREVRDGEGENYVIRDGIVVIPRGAVVPDGTVI